MTSVLLHASSVALAGRAILIVGASGRGKSALAIQLMALGAGLISDDATRVSLRDGSLFAAAPPRLAGLVEARGIGILSVPAALSARVALIVDMDIDETDRLPPRRTREVLGCALPLIYRGDPTTFASALILLLQGHRHA
ncbi:HPr kinase/phosphorylase [Loktanella sp. DSM 29012]|uniref:HPr kinase/phosphorylase n=1 Tax=Loktanella sp. DSM 29012 TaxID=1881056 RepID=UPI0008AD6781|nr:hypothetical protein [Loktanella sp. DSM 29012]SEP70303.1 HPr kinase/phosphorylase [Loktanella sp. DSM 29012]